MDTSTPPLNPWKTDDDRWTKNIGDFFVYAGLSVVVLIIFVGAFFTYSDLVEIRGRWSTQSETNASQALEIETLRAEVKALQLQLRLQNKRIVGQLKQFNSISSEMTDLVNQFNTQMEDVYALEGNVP